VRQTPGRGTPIWCRAGGTAELIRSAQESDLEPITALLAQLGYPFGASDVEAVLAELLRDPAHFVLVAQDGAVVGYVNANFRTQLHHLAPVGTIDELVVDEGRRGRRIGERLVEAVLEEGRRRGADTVEVTTHERRERARVFYRRCGFEATSTKLVYQLAGGHESRP
jgi:GNAT superfamily N-acetyltransferase